MSLKSNLYPKTIIVIALLMLGCKKEEDCQDEIIANPQVDLLIKEVYENDTLVRSYTYDSENRLESRINSNEEDISALETYQYSGDTIIRTLFNDNNEIIYKYKYYPIENNIIRRDRESFFGSMSFTYALYHFDGNPCGNDFFEIYNADNTISSQSINEFSGPTCNLLSTLQDENGQVFLTFEYIRDNQKAYFTSARNQLTNPNPIGNLTKFIRADEMGVVDIDQSFESIFTYNSNAYPETEIRTYDNGETVNVAYSYN